MSTVSEKRFRTDTETVNFPARRITGLPVRVKKVTTTDEGRLQITMEGEVMDREGLEKIQELLMIQQGDAIIDITGAQGDMFL